MNDILYVLVAISFNDNDINQMGYEEIAYFKNKEEAIHAAESNIGDYNDGGCYDYGLVLSVRYGIPYALCDRFGDGYLFKFDYNNRKYQSIPFEDTDIGSFIKRSFCIEESGEIDGRN